MTCVPYLALQHFSMMSLFGTKFSTAATDNSEGGTGWNNADSLATKLGQPTVDEDGRSLAFQV